MGIMSGFGAICPRQMYPTFGCCKRVALSKLSSMEQQLQVSFSCSFFAKLINRIVGLHLGEPIHQDGDGRGPEAKFFPQEKKVLLDLLWSVRGSHPYLRPHLLEVLHTPRPSSVDGKYSVGYQAKCWNPWEQPWVSCSQRQRKTVV